MNFIQSIKDALANPKNTRGLAGKIIIDRSALIGLLQITETLDDAIRDEFMLPENKEAPEIIFGGKTHNIKKASIKLMAGIIDYKIPMQHEPPTRLINDVLDLLADAIDPFLYMDEAGHARFKKQLIQLLQSENKND